MHLKRDRRVRSDIQEAFRWYEQQQPGLGRRFTAALRSAFRDLRSNPKRYAIRFGDVRRVNLAVFPYAIFYFLDAEVIVIIGVMHVRRDTGPLIKARRESLET